MRADRERLPTAAPTKHALDPPPSAEVGLPGVCPGGGPEAISVPPPVLWTRFAAAVPRTFPNCTCQNLHHLSRGSGKGGGGRKERP